MTRMDTPPVETLFYEGQEWVPKAWADDLLDKLREKQRTQASHNHQFAEIHDLWANLPISHAQAPYAASAEAFRKHGLIVTGYCDVVTFSFATDEEAKEQAPKIAELARRGRDKRDPEFYALVVARGPLVVCSTPESQSYRAMGKDRFNASKAAVLDWGHSLLGVTA